METNDTTPVWGYKFGGAAHVFQLKGDEVLPDGWYESPSLAETEGRNQAVERELRYALERRAAALPKFTIDPAWDITRLEAAVHRAEAQQASEKKVAPKKAEEPQEAKDASDAVSSRARAEAEIAVGVPPVGESGAELGQTAVRIDQQQREAARLLKEDNAVKRAQADADAKPTAEDIAAAKKAGK